MSLKTGVESNKECACALEHVNERYYLKVKMDEVTV